MRVLYLTYDGLTDPLGQSQILPYLAGLAKKGFSISIVSFEKKSRTQQQSAIENFCVQNNLFWHPMTYHRTPPIFSTLFDLIRLLSASKKLHRKEKFQIIHCRSYITALVGLYFRRRNDVKFVFDMRGFWADERVEGGLWNLNNPLFLSIYKFFKKQEQNFIAYADAIVVLTHAAKKIVLRWNASADVYVIPCAADLKIFDPARIDEQEKQKMRNSLGIRSDNLVLLYLGSLGTWYLWDQMIIFFESIKRHYPSIRFLVVTPDAKQVEAREDVILRTATREEVPKYIAVSDAAVCFIKPTFSKSGSSATKVGEILAMGIPVYVNNGWGDVMHYYKYRQNLIVNLSQLNDFQMEWSSDKIVYRQLAVEHFNLDRGIDSYEQIYTGLIHEKS